MEKPTNRKVVIITDASSGNGAAVARRLARDGIRLTLAARHLDRLEQVAAEVKVLAGKPSSCKPMCATATNSGSMKPERLSRNVVYQSPWVNLYLDKVKFPNGFVIEKFHLLDFPRAAVTAIVENDLGNIVFARICRYTTGATEWELPAGGVEIGESEIDAAKREVLEETGYTSDNHQLIYSYYPMNGSANKLFHVVRCRAIDHIQDFDKNEVSETRWFTKDEVKQMVKDKVITDGFTLTALLLWLQS